MKAITNETGTFFVDDNGVLLRYESTPQTPKVPQNDDPGRGCITFG